MPVRRAVQPVAAVAPPPPPSSTGEVFDIFDVSQYAVGKMIPEGDYAVEFVVQEHQSIKAETGQAVGKPRLVVMLVAYPLKGGDPYEQPVSFGSKAIASWVPTANGKGIQKRAGGPGLPPTNKSNWMYFLDSMIQSGMPVDALKGNDLSAIDGTWMHIQPVPEPEERKSFRKTAATGEAQEDDEPRGNGLMPACTGFIEGGKPWEGGGGFGFVQQAPAAPAAPARVATRPAPVAARPAAVAPAAAPRRAPVAVPPPPPPPQTEEPEGEMTLEDAALEAIGNVLTKPGNAKSLKIMKARMDVHAVATEKFGDQTATDIVNQFFGGNDANLLNLLGNIDYTISGTGPQREIVPAAK